MTWVLVIVGYLAITGYKTEDEKAAAKVQPPPVELNDEIPL